MWEHRTDSVLSFHEESVYQSKIGRQLVKNYPMIGKTKIFSFLEYTKNLISEKENFNVDEVPVHFDIPSNRLVETNSKLCTDL